MLSKNDELFLTVAKSESISKAAEQLYISQPSLTKRMQQLEALPRQYMHNKENAVTMRLSAH